MPPILVITAHPAWLPQVQELLGTAFTLTSYADRNNYIARLADANTALILVDHNLPDWKQWVTPVKVSPATRRIPIVLIGDAAVNQPESLVAGVDFVLPVESLAARLPEMVERHARIPDPEQMRELECGCAEVLPPLAVEGVAKFNAGEYYPQHDLFEAQWVQTTGPVRDLYRAILQVGVAYYQIERGNHRGALKMLLRSVQWLQMLPDVCQGVDVRQLREDSYRVRAALEALPPDEIAHFDRSLLRPLRLVTS
jgi:predicted metal-dependent hydrolase